jgi:hypothetical protein
MIGLSESIISLGIQGWSLNGNPSSEEEFNESFSVAVGSDEYGSAIMSSDPADFGVTWTQVKAKYDELVAAEPMRLLRAERNQRLANTDWWASSDLTMTAEQTAYRQALRDITDTYTSLDDVVWPEEPNV